MKKLAFISDVFFYGALTAFFTLCFFRFLRISLFASALLALVCGGLVSCAAFCLISRKRKAVFLKRSQEREKQILLENLCLLSKEKQLKFFKTLFSLETQSLEKTSKSTHFSSENAHYFLRLHFTPVCQDEVAGVSRWKTQKQKIIVCNAVDEQAKSLADRLNIAFFTGDEIYQTVLKVHILEENLLQKAPLQKQKRTRLYFSKRNAKPFAASGFLLLFSSFFTPFPFYYLVFGGVLFALAVSLRIFGYR